MYHKAMRITKVNIGKKPLKKGIGAPTPTVGKIEKFSLKIGGKTITMTSNPFYPNKRYMRTYENNKWRPANEKEIIAILKMRQKNNKWKMLYSNQEISDIINNTREWRKILNKKNQSLL